MWIDTRTTEQKRFDDMADSLYDLSIKLMKGHNWNIRTCTLQLEEFVQICGTFDDHRTTFLDLPGSEIDRLCASLNKIDIGVHIQFIAGQSLFVGSGKDPHKFHSLDASLLATPTH